MAAEHLKFIFDQFDHIEVFKEFEELASGHINDTYLVTTDSRRQFILQRINDGVYGLPFHDGPECMIYRKDLFEDVNEQQNFKKLNGYELNPPKTWKEFVTIAEFFNRPHKNLYGCVFANYPDGHNMVFDFCLQLWTRGGKLLNSKNQIDIHTQEAVVALDFYRKITQNENTTHPGTKYFGSVEAGMAFAKGEAALAINWFGFASMCEVIEESKVKGKVEIAELPFDEGKTTASLNVYWLYTIASGSKNKKLAYDFLKFATTPEAVDNAAKIADQCSLELTLGKFIFPHFPIPEGETKDSLLEKLALAGLKERGLADNPEAQDRLKHELGLIKMKDKITSRTDPAIKPNISPIALLVIRETKTATNESRKNIDILK